MHVHLFALIRSSILVPYSNLFLISGKKEKNVDHRFLLRLLMCHKDKTYIYYVVTSRLVVYEDWYKTHMFKTLRIMSLRWTLRSMTIT